MTIPPPSPQLPVPLSRAEHGRWLGGVCAGLARIRDLPVGRLRTAFVLARRGRARDPRLPRLLADHPRRGRATTAPRPRAASSCSRRPARPASAWRRSARSARRRRSSASAGSSRPGRCGARRRALLAGRESGPAGRCCPSPRSCCRRWRRRRRRAARAAERTRHAWRPATLAAGPAHGYRSGLGTMFIDLRHTALPARAGRS